MFLNPLPPLGSVYLSHLEPVSFSPAGICAFNLQAFPSVGRPSQSGRFLAFSEITNSTIDGAYLLINNERFVKCATPGQAKELAGLITKAAKASPAERERLLRAHTGKQFDVDEAAKVLREGMRVIGPIRWVCSILFLFLFVATPIMVSISGLPRLLIPVAAVMLALSIQISIMFHFARKALYPGEPRWDRHSR